MNKSSGDPYEDLVSLWPDDDNRWPETVRRVETVDAFVELFSVLGFEQIPINAIGITPRFEKIAIFAADDGTVPTHVARQCRNGRWTRKMGAQVDTDHADLHCLEGGE